MVTFYCKMPIIYVKYPESGICRISVRFVELCDKCMFSKTNRKKYAYYIEISDNLISNDCISENNR